jgi:hypothetical protein
MYQPPFKAAYVIFFLLVLLLLSASKVLIVIFIFFFYGEFIECLFTCKNDYLKNFGLEDEDDDEDDPFWDISMWYITDEVASQWETEDRDIDEEDEEGQLQGMEALDYELDWDQHHINIPKRAPWMEVDSEEELDFCFDLYRDTSLIRSSYKYNSIIDCNNFESTVKIPKLG